MPMRHSPGPWTFQERGSLILDARTGDNQCAVAHVQVNTYKNEGFYNARLIAAAPELLSALIELVRRAETVSHMEGDALHRACAAIIKATGDSS